MCYTMAVAKLDWEKLHQQARSQRRVPGSLVTMVARYDSGQCHVCQRKIKKNTRMVWDPIAGLGRHSGCITVKR